MFTFNIVLTFVVILYNFYRTKDNIICLSNMVLISYFLIFIASPVIIEGNPVIDDDIMQLCLIVSLLLMVIVFRVDMKIGEPIKEINFYRYGMPINVLKMVVIFILLNGIYLIVSGELIQSFVINRSSSRLEMYYVQKDINLIDIAKECLYLFFYALIPFIGQTKKNRKYVYLGFFGIIIDLLTYSEHRSPIAFTALLLIIYIHIYVKKIRVLYFIVIGVLVIIFMSFAAYIRTGDIDSAIDSGLTFNQQLAHGLSGLNTSESMMEMKLLIDRTDYEYGYTFLMYLITPIPRRLWIEKPNVSFSSRMTENLYGRIGDGNWIRTFTMWGEGYSQFGYVGILIFTILFLTMVRFSLRILSNYRGFEFLVLKYIVQIPLLLRADFFATYSRILFLFTALFFFYIIFGIKKVSNMSNISTSRNNIFKSILK